MSVKRLYKVEIATSVLVMATHRQEAESVARGSLLNRIEFNRLEMFTDPVEPSATDGVDLSALECMTDLQSVPPGSDDERTAAEILRELQREGGC